MIEERENENGTIVPLSALRAIVDEALRQLPTGASAQEKQRAIELARVAVRENESATKPELIDAVSLAVACVAEDVRGRLRREQWRTRALLLLPFGADDGDKRAARKTALELLNHIPLEASDSQVQAEIREALQPLCKEIENGQRIDELIAYGRSCVGDALFDLYRDDCITREDWLDLELRGQLQETVNEELSQDGDYVLDGSETSEDVKEMVADIIADELDLEVVEDDPGDKE